MFLFAVKLVLVLSSMKLTVHALVWCRSIGLADEKFRFHYVFGPM